MCLQGNGLTVTLATTGTLGRIVSAGEWTESVEDILDNDLGIKEGDHDQYCAGATIQHEPWPFVVAFSDPTALAEIRVTQLITVTFANGASISGDGWIQSRAVGSMESNTRSEAPVAIRFKGGSGGIGRTAPTP